MDPTPRDPHSTVLAFGQHEAPRCPTPNWPCPCDGKRYTLDDVRTLVCEWPRTAQARILGFGLALPPELVSDYWRIVWIANAATMDTEREEDALSAVLTAIAARAAQEVPA